MFENLRNHMEIRNNNLTARANKIHSKIQELRDSLDPSGVGGGQATTVNGKQFRVVTLPTTSQLLFKLQQEQQRRVMPAGLTEELYRQSRMANPAAMCMARGKEDKADENSGPVNLNTASVDKLCTLPGVGPKAAADIVRHREFIGAFTAAKDIAKVSGFGASRIKKLVPLVCV